MTDQLSAILRDKGNDVTSIGPQTSVLDAVRVMNEVGIGSVVVVEKGLPVGIFTERDVLRRVIDHLKDPEHTPVQEVMTKHLVVVSPTHTVKEAMSIMTLKRCRHLPVIDSNRLVGIVSIGDLTRWVSRNQQIELVDLNNYITGRYPV